MMMALLLLFSLSQPLAVSEWRGLVPENGPNYSIANDVLEMRAAPGWLKTDRLLIDFDLDFEFRAITPEIDAGVVVRSWTGERLWPARGYRLNLPLQDSGVGRLLTARRERATVVHRGQLDLHPPGAWQKVHVAAERSRIRMIINGTLAGEFEIERMIGLVLLENRTGTVQVRNLTIRPRPIDSRIPDEVIGAGALEAAGGRVPEAVREIKPQYTMEAMRARVEGVVTLHVVVGADGLVGAVRVARSLDPVLDVNAVAAMRGWRFRPGTLNGAPVPVVMEIEMKFAVH